MKRTINVKRSLLAQFSSRRHNAAVRRKVNSELYSNARLLTLLKSNTAQSRAAIARAVQDGKLDDTVVWYRASYKVFMPRQQVDPDSKSEFLRRVAYAYSWVATIARADPRKHFSRITSDIKKLRSAESCTPYCAITARKAREKLLKSVQDALNIKNDKGGVVIASKVMHFWNCELAPMIDKNVALAWRALTPTSDWKHALRAAVNPPRGTISDQPTSDQYLSYWEIAYQFRECRPGGISYRALDQLLFFYGSASSS